MDREDFVIDELVLMTVERMIETMNIPHERYMPGEVIVLDQSVDLESHKHILSTPCRIDAISLMLCIQGSMRVKVDFREYTIEKGMVYVNLPQNIVQMEHLDNFRVIGVVVSAPYMKALNADITMLMPMFHQFQRHNTIAIDQNKMELISKYLELLNVTVRVQNSPYKREIVRNMISMLCYSVREIVDSRKRAEISEGAVSSKHAMVYERFMRLLVENYAAQRSVAFYAEQLSLTPKYFSKIIYDFSGRSAAGWIDEYVMIEAKTLLKFSRMTIYQISEYLNFASQSFFGRYFKHHAGMSPGDFRRNG